MGRVSIIVFAQYFRYKILILTKKHPRWLVQNPYLTQIKSPEEISGPYHRRLKEPKKS